MKKKIKWICLCLIAAIAIFLYAHIDKATMLYDKNVDNSEYRITGTTFQTIEQEFKATENSLDGVRFKISMIGEYQNVEMDYQFLDMESGKVLRAGNLPVEELKPTKFAAINFEKLENTKGKSYKLILTMDGNEEYSGIAGYYEAKTEADTKLTIDGNDVDGTMVLKTITKRFDLETAVVLLSFVLYLVVFMKVLYKFFR